MARISHIPPPTHLVLGVDKVREGAQLFQLILVLVHLNQRSIILPDPIERILLSKRHPPHPVQKQNKHMMRVMSIWQCSYSSLASDNTVPLTEFPLPYL